MLKTKYAYLPWTQIKSHNYIPELSKSQNLDFPNLKRHLIIGVRKTHKYTENHKVSDWLVPYTPRQVAVPCA
jgi:spore photoproduct lyase